ncbi:MAG: gamma-glutamyl-gamma-aminobutyrate hydrolase family protein [Planctomycetota bacterium]
MRTPTYQHRLWRHVVKLAPDSRIARIIGAQTARTNSCHHQAVQLARVGQGLIATAWASDGIIEAIESATQARFILGVQWHPERQIVITLPNIFPSPLL